MLIFLVIPTIGGSLAIYSKIRKNGWSGFKEEMENSLLVFFKIIGWVAMAVSSLWLVLALGPLWIIAILLVIILYVIVNR